MRSININDGLVSNQVRGFYQDRKGFIWIMTWEGLSRYDGYAFRNYSLAEGLAHPLINDMFEGKDGRIFIAENDGSVDVMIQGEIHKELRNRYKTPINQFVRESAGIVLAPSDNSGIFVFDEGTVTPLNSSGAAITVNDVISYEGYFIICGLKAGVMRHDHTFINVWPDSLSYISILQDNLHRIWIGTSKGLRLVNLSGEGNRQFSLTETRYKDTQWGHWPVNEILQSSEGSIWIAAVGGLIQIRPDQTWRVYNRSDGLPNDNITAVFEDKTGFIWIGTDQGIAVLDAKNTIDIFTISEEFPNTIITDILPTQDGGAYILGNTPEVNKIKVGQLMQSIPLNNSSNGYKFLCTENDTIVNTTNAYYALKDRRITQWTEIPYSRSQASIIVDSNLFSCFGGMITISSRKETFSDTSFHDQIYAIVADLDSGIWVAFLNLGLFKILVRKNELGESELVWKDFNEYLPEKTIRSINCDLKGNVWVGTRYSGLIQLSKNTNNDRYTTHRFGRKEGFISDFIKAVVSDQDGNIWVGTNAGIEKLVQEGDGYRVFSFSRVHNFFGAMQQIVIGPDHTLWCVSTSSVVRLTDSSYDTTAPSTVYITSVATANKTLIDPKLKLPFDLNYNQNYLDIEFSSHDFINGNQLKYSYRLTGSQDTSWSKPLPVHKVSFANLFPGEYRFEVKVMGWNGVFGDVTYFNFNILPPFWQRAWFIILSILAIIGLIFSFYRYRIRQLKRIQDIRNRIASDLHDEIGSSLTHVNILSEIGRKTPNQNDQPQQLFKRIGEEVQSSSEALDDIIWSVSSRVDTAEDLISRMRRYASELFDAKNIAFSLHVGHLDENQSIGLELRRDFYLIYKELLRNIVRHADATEVNMRILREDQFLSMVVADNGRGFDPDAASDRHGLKSIKGRVAKWKGLISIDSSQQTGTVIKIGLPLKKNISL